MKYSSKKINNNDKKEKNQLPYYACSLLIICFIGAILLVAVAFTTSRSHSLRCLLKGVTNA